MITYPEPVLAQPEIAPQDRAKQVPNETINLKFLSQCGNPIHRNKFPKPATNRTRYVCTHWRHHPTTRIRAFVAGCLVFTSSRCCLLPPRIEPSPLVLDAYRRLYGNGETTEERPCARLGRSPGQRSATNRCTCSSTCAINQVIHVLPRQLVDQALRRRRREPEVAPVPRKQNIPWDGAGLSHVGKTLKQYFSDRRSQTLPVRGCATSAYNPALAKRSLNAPFV